MDMNIALFFIYIYPMAFFTQLTTAALIITCLPTREWVIARIARLVYQANTTAP